MVANRYGWSRVTRVIEVQYWTKEGHSDQPITAKEIKENITFPSQVGKHEREEFEYFYDVVTQRYWGKCQHCYHGETHDPNKMLQNTLNYLGNHSLQLFC